MSLFVKSTGFTLPCNGYPMEETSSRNGLLKTVLRLLSHYTDCSDDDHLSHGMKNDHNSQCNIFDHLAEGFHYLSMRKPTSSIAAQNKRIRWIEKQQQKLSDQYSSSHPPEAAEIDRCPSSISSIRPLESTEEMDDLDTERRLPDLPGDLNSLSTYCYHEWDEAFSEDVIFIDVAPKYSSDSDISCKFIINHPKELHSGDRIAINQYADDCDGSWIYERCLVYHPMSRTAARLKRRSVLELTFSRSALSSVSPIDKQRKYRFEYISCVDDKVLGCSDMFCFIDSSTGSFDCQSESDEDGFILVKP
ncbi:uncharacterized protein LOC141852475 [Brevipalpus obovatus]|uniref:uncharacterized protein LOC141852475 n=1 Tax=Brevipalpus obovatus TaxID=246614 RepID=UPI003D9DD62D